jgi:hypothetical protein
MNHLMRQQQGANQSHAMAVFREVVFGADETSPRRPGRHLETRQRLGILPTWAFWNRRDVWSSTRWFACPVVFFALQGGFWIPCWLELSFVPRLIAAQAIGVGTLALALGALERWLRKKMRARRVQARAALDGSITASG